MKLNYYYRNIIKFSVISFLLISTLSISTNGMMPQDNPVMAPNVSQVPKIDGIGDDQCWGNIPWQSIDEIWVPDTAVISSDDYSGHYKIVWSYATNLLYFLIEVHDDVFVDGFQKGKTADVYNFDITEVFIDENASGGPHVSDTKTTNAENAFAYHMYADFPDSGNVTTNLYVFDFATIPPDYAFHFPEFALRKNGNTATWEFSLIVYNDTYSPTRIDSSRALLKADKVIGLSVAYCDNDKNDGMRDNMFGSVWEPAPKNRHWMNADTFGRVKLVSETPTDVENKSGLRANTRINLYPNPATTFSTLQLNDPGSGDVSIRLFNLLGQEVIKTNAIKADQNLTIKLNLNNLSSGIYFLQTQIGKSINCEKLIITDNR
jgi:hypothetical protein